MMIVKMKASKSLKAAIDYILSEMKATLKIAMNLNDAEDVVVQMERMERLWGKNKENTRQAYHLKLCFNPKDDVRNGGILTDSLAMKVALRIIKEAFPDHQVVLAVHNDTPNKHVHAVIGAVNMMTGKKLNMRMAEYRWLKDRANEISAEFGLSTLDWREATREKRNREVQSDLPINYCFTEQGMNQRGKNSWKGELRNIIDEAAIGSESIEEFKEKLARKNVILTRCSANVISYKFGEHRAVRGDTLGGDYTMAAIQDALKYYRDWPNNINVSREEREMYRNWGRMAGVRRSEIDAICDEIHHATWQQKWEVWTDYKQIKDEFWSDYKKRKVKLQDGMDEAYRRRMAVKDADWVLNVRNRKRTLAGIVFAAIIRHRFGNRKQIEDEIQMLRSKQKALRDECLAFRNASNEALQTLRQKGLSLGQYLSCVEKMQNLAEGMFQQSTEEMALLWRIEQNARVKEPSLDDYLKNAYQESDMFREQEEKENEKE